MDWSQIVKIKGSDPDRELTAEESIHIDAASFEVSREEWRRFLFEAVIEDANEVMRAHEIYGGAQRIIEKLSSKGMLGFLQTVFGPDQDQKWRNRLVEIAQATVRLIEACEEVGVHIIGREGGVLREVDQGRFSSPAPEVLDGP